MNTPFAPRRRRFHSGFKRLRRRIAVGRLIFHCKTAYKTDIIGKRLLAISPARREPSSGGRITQLS